MYPTTANNLIEQDVEQTEMDFQIKRAEFKNRLGSIRKRTKLLLEKHNWKKYFQETNQPNMFLREKNIQNIFDCEMHGEQQMNEYDFDLNDQSVFNYSLEESTSYYTNSSFVSTVEFIQEKKKSKSLSSKMNLITFCPNDEHIQEPSKQSNNKSALNFIRSISNIKYNDTNNSFLAIENDQDSHMAVKAQREINMSLISQNNMKLVFGTPVSTRKPKRNIDMNNVELITLSPIAIKKQRNQASLKRQPQSLTFIADLASTSTPTRNTQQPIASTPKFSSHDPLMYHPTHTIRKKHSKKQQSVKSKRVSKKTTALVAKQQIGTIKIKTLSSKKKYATSTELNIDDLKYRKKSVKRDFQCLNCDNNSNHQHKIVKSKSASKAKRTKYCSIHLSASFLSSNNSNDHLQCNLCNLSEIKSNNKQRTTTTNNKRIKAKSKLNFELSLHDLLYKPIKISQVNNNSFSSALAVKSAVTTSNKVYFL